MTHDILHDEQKVLFLVVSFIAVMDLIIALVFFIDIKRFVANARTVKARITKLEAYNKGTRAYICFKDPFGKEITTKIMISGSKKYKANDEIEVLSHKDNPALVRLNSFMSLWMLPLFTAQAAVILAIAIGVLLYMDVFKFPV